MMKILSEKQVNAIIKRRNAVFDKATWKQKRIMIIKDFLQQLENKRCSAEEQCYIKFNGPIKNFNIFQERNFRDDFLSCKIKKCNVCAIGGLMMSAILYKNKVNYSYNKILYGSDAQNLINKFFSDKELRIIECAFEGYVKFDVGDISYEILDKCFDFYEKYRNKNERLVVILKNMLKNGGKFVLP